MAIQPFHTGGRNRARTIEVQGAQGRVEDPCPIRVLLWLQGGSQGHSSCNSNIVVCSSRRAQMLSGNHCAFFSSDTPTQDDRRTRGRTPEVQGAQG